ncbi:MAG: UpxY family transcription antiterminator [Candidatus Neomarinimicrobiota bacterium]|nr:MAG: UpxY family transcription antiterminator [Candidatus Neomarinimicrobiota bacterium]
MDKETWIAVYTKPRHEKKVMAEFEKRMIQHYLPLVRRKRRWSDRMKWVDMPLFPSYIFARIELKNSLYVLQTPGVHHIVKHGQEIARVPEQQIESVRIMLEGEDLPETEDYFVEGDEAEVIGGPMRGLQGIVIRRAARNHIVIRIDAIRTAISVQIDPRYLRKLKKSHGNPVL